VSRRSGGEEDGGGEVVEQERCECADRGGGPGSAGVEEVRRAAPKAGEGAETRLNALAQSPAAVKRVCVSQNRLARLSYSSRTADYSAGSAASTTSSRTMSPSCTSAMLFAITVRPLGMMHVAVYASRFSCPTSARNPRPRNSIATATRTNVGGTSLGIDRGFGARERIGANASYPKNVSRARPIS
jgi:hypothetical protein